MTALPPSDPGHPARIASLAVSADTGGPTYGGQLTGLTALAVSMSPAAGGPVLVSGDQNGVVTLWKAGDPARMARMVALPRQGHGATGPRCPRRRSPPVGASSPARATMAP